MRSVNVGHDEIVEFALMLVGKRCWPEMVRLSAPRGGRPARDGIGVRRSERAVLLPPSFSTRAATTISYTRFFAKVVMSTVVWRASRRLASLLGCGLVHEGHGVHVGEGGAVGLSGDSVRVDSNPGDVGRGADTLRGSGLDRRSRRSSGADGRDHGLQGDLVKDDGAGTGCSRDGVEAGRGVLDDGCEGVELHVKVDALELRADDVEGRGGIRGWPCTSSTWGRRGGAGGPRSSTVEPFRRRSASCLGIGKFLEEEDEWAGGHDRCPPSDR